MSEFPPGWAEEEVELPGGVTSNDLNDHALPH